MHLPGGWCHPVTRANARSVPRKPDIASTAFQTSGAALPRSTVAWQFELLLADAMHQLDARNLGRRAPETLEAEHHRDALLHAPMVLLDQIVQVFRRAQLRVPGRAVQRSWTACTESTLQHMGGEMPKLMAQGIPEPANV